MHTINLDRIINIAAVKGDHHWNTKELEDIAQYFILVNEKMKVGYAKVSANTEPGDC